jgi:hypothetical protein
MNLLSEASSDRRAPEPLEVVRIGLRESSDRPAGIAAKVEHGANSSRGRRGDSLASLQLRVVGSTKHNVTQNLPRAIDLGHSAIVPASIRVVPPRERSVGGPDHLRRGEGGNLKYNVKVGAAIDAQRSVAAM